MAVQARERIVILARSRQLRGWPSSACAHSNPDAYLENRGLCTWRRRARRNRNGKQNGNWQKCFGLMCSATAGYRMVPSSTKTHPKRWTCRATGSKAAGADRNASGAARCARSAASRLMSAALSHAIEVNEDCNCSMFCWRFLRNIFEKTFLRIANNLCHNYHILS